MVIPKDSSSDNLEIKRLCDSLVQKFTDFNAKKWVSLDVDLTGVLQLLYAGACVRSLDEPFRLQMLEFVKLVLAFNDSYALQHGVCFKDKISMALLLRVACFNPEQEVFTIPELKGNFLCFRFNFCLFLLLSSF